LSDGQTHREENQKVTGKPGKYTNTEHRTNTAS